MGITFSLPIGQETTGGAVLVDDAVSTINLRVSPFSAAAYNGSFIDHGVYQFTNVDDGTYRVYSGGTHLSIFGEIRIGNAEALLSSATTYLKKVTDISGTYWEAQGLEIRSPIATITENTSLISGVEVDSRISTSEALQANLAGGNTFAGNQSFQDDVSFENDPPTCASPPPGDDYLANKAYVDDTVAGVVIEPYQESPNCVRLIPGGTQQTNQVYTTYAAVLYWAMSYATSSRRITVDIRGMGTAGATSITMVSQNTGGGDMFVDDYINFNGVNQSIVLVPPDDTVSVSTLGNSKFSNLTIYDASASSDTIWTNIEFNNVYFDLTVNTVTFNNCRFLNCYIKVNTDGDNSATFTNCKGAGNTTNQDWGSSAVRGDSGVPKADF